MRLRRTSAWLNESSAWCPSAAFVQQKMQKAVVKLSEDGIIMDTDNTYIINYIIYNTYIYIYILIIWVDW